MSEQNPPLIQKNDQLILEHYRKVAKNFGDSANSAIQDPYIKSTEIKFFTRAIQDFIIKEERIPFVLDVGCGNGYLIECLRQQFPKMPIAALEFSPELCKIAQDRKLPGVEVQHGDIRKGPLWKHKVDIVITERVVINVLDAHEQRMALTNIAQILHPQGEYLLSESFLQPWRQLNRARKEMSLPEIPQSPHNLYLTDKQLAPLYKHDMVEIQASVPRNSLSSHFFISRILHPTVRPDGGRGKGSLLGDFFNEALPSNAGNYSPIQFRQFKKRWIEA